MKVPARSWMSRRLLPYVLISLATVIVWVAFTSLRGVVADHQPSLSPASYYARDPYCLVDPTCVSPLYRPPGVAVNGDYAHWEGLWWINPLDPLLTAPSSLYLFALPNYVFFVLLMSAISYLAARYIRNHFYYRLLLTALVTWCVTEAAAWSLTLGAADPQLGNIALFAFGVVTLAVTIQATRGASQWGRSQSHAA